jgi:hypothetical protein
VLFSKRCDVDRCKLAIEHFWRLVPSKRDKAAAVRDIQMDDLSEENRARLMGAKVSKSGVILGAENLEEVKKAHLKAGEARGLCMGVDVQNLSVEMAGQVPLGWLMGYMRAFDNWRARQAARDVESVGESEVCPIYTICPTTASDSDARTAIKEQIGWGGCESQADRPAEECGSECG